MKIKIPPNQSYNENIFIEIKIRKNTTIHQTTSTIKCIPATKKI